MSVLHQCDAALQAEQKANAIQAQIIADEDARFNEEHKELESASIWKPIAIGGISLAIGEGLLLLLKR